MRPPAREAGEGRLAMTVLTLRPRVEFPGERLPSRDEVERMRHRAHETGSAPLPESTAVTTSVATSFGRSSAPPSMHGPPPLHSPRV